ncbi:hypothetical protein ACRALDRAFT_1055609 [Sodiomyces alcalophilus JCM 7366]|uniref:uncharacterized protein n=1 Tax=Sodiomyces alcalophilus JCM 7366 TaxID=591952 RepID=UPI0039B4F7B6
MGNGSPIGHGHSLVGHLSPKADANDAVPTATPASATASEGHLALTTAFSGTSPTVNGFHATEAEAEVNAQDPEPQTQDPSPEAQDPGQQAHSKPQAQDSTPQTQDPEPEEQHVNQPGAELPFESLNQDRAADQQPVSASTEPSDVLMIDAPSEVSKPSSEPAEVSSSSEPTGTSSVPVPTENTSPTVANANAIQTTSPSIPTATVECESASITDAVQEAAANPPSIETGADNAGNMAASANTTTTPATTNAGESDPTAVSINRPSSLPPVNLGPPSTGLVSRSNSAGPAIGASTGISTGAPTAAPAGLSAGASTQATTGGASTGSATAGPAVSTSASSAVAPAAASASPHNTYQQLPASRSLPQILAQLQSSFSNEYRSSFSRSPSTGTASPAPATSTPPVSGQVPPQAPQAPQAPPQAPTHASTHAPPQVAPQGPSQAPPPAPPQAPQAPTQAPTQVPPQVPPQAHPQAPPQAPTHAPTQAAPQVPTGTANPAQRFSSTQSPGPSTQPLPANTGQASKFPRSAQPPTLPVAQNQQRPSSHPREFNPHPTGQAPTPGVLTPKFHDEVEVLSRHIRKASPQAVRRVIRDHWQKCLLGSDYHLAFITNAAIHHAAGDAINRAMRDFGQKMIHDARMAFAQHLTTEILDDIAPVLIQKASDRFLDRALQARLPTIPAKSLLNALARSERLGYDAEDIVEDDNENVFPPPGPAAGPTGTSTAPASATPPASVGQPRPPQSYPPHVPGPHVPGPPHQAHPPHQSHQPHPPHPPHQSHQPQLFYQAHQPHQAHRPHQTHQVHQPYHRHHIHPQQANAAPNQWSQSAPPPATAPRQSWTALSRPNHNPTPPQTPGPPANVYSSAPSASSTSSKRYRCTLCKRTFATPAPYDHHMRKMVCQKKTPREGWLATCKDCGQGFVSGMGLQYHTSNKVCSEIKPRSGASWASATPASAVTPASRPAEKSGDTPPLIQSDIAGYAPPRPPSPPAGQPSSQLSATPGRPGSSRAVFSARPGVATKGFNEISPAANASLEQELQVAKDTYRLRAEEARRTVTDKEELQRQMVSFRNCMNSRMSTIRRRYGVRIRERRSQKELDEERSWFELSPPKSDAGSSQTGTPTPSYPRAGEKRPNGTVDDRADKRPRLDGAAAPPVPLNTLSVSEMNGGLQGTSATAAVHDPTAAPAGVATVAQGKPAPARYYGGTQVQPVEIDSSSDDSDGDIPAR